MCIIASMKIEQKCFVAPEGAVAQSERAPHGVEAEDDEYEDK